MSGFSYDNVNEVFRCKSCGAPRKPFCSECEYCRSQFVHNIEEYTGRNRQSMVSGIPMSFGNSFACSGTFDVRALLTGGNGGSGSIGFYG